MVTTAPRHRAHGNGVAPGVDDDAGTSDAASADQRGPVDTLFPVPDGAACLYVGSVMHARLQPVTHRFTYRVASLLIDIDRLDAAASLSRFFSVNRRNVMSFRENDHGEGDAARPLSERVRATIAKTTEVDADRILLLCYPRLFGYVFNPLSVYFVYGRSGNLTAVVYEVRNTFGGLNSYVEPVADNTLTPAGIRQARDKAFYVSPFIGPVANYRFRIRPPGDAVTLRILETDPAGPVLAATFSGTRITLSDRTILSRLIRDPLMTYKVIVGIHVEALRLWLKGARYHAPPTDTPKAPTGCPLGSGAPHGRAT